MGDNRKQLDGEDIGKLWKLLNDNNVQLPSFVARGLRRILQIDPSTIDLCCLVDSIAELRNKLLAFQARKKMAALSEAVNREKQAASSIGSPFYAKKVAQNILLQVALLPIELPTASLVSSSSLGHTAPKNTNQRSKRPPLIEVSGPVPTTTLLNYRSFYAAFISMWATWT